MTDRSGNHDDFKTSAQDAAAPSLTEVNAAAAFRCARLPRRWAVVLAGGDGVRLRPLTRLICGDDRPKQFCPLYGGATLVEHARQRAERSVQSDHVLFSLTRPHEAFYTPILPDCRRQWIVQPSNRGTGAAIVSSLLFIARRQPEALVAVFPSDHHYSDEDVVTEAVENAFELAEAEPQSVVLLGARPSRPEVEYGWIELGDPISGGAAAFRVRGFHEKPSRETASLLLERQALWNTFVMIGPVLSFLEAICSAAPGLVGALRHSAMPHAPRGEIRLEESAYARIPPVDFSRQILSAATGRLIVRQLGPVVWNDLGDCNRALDALAEAGFEPDWAKPWRATPSAASAVA